MGFIADTAANLIAVVHIGYFVFVVGGMVAILVGSRRDIGWVHNLWFRIAHITVIYVVLVEEANGLPCPLNVLQWGARKAATGSAEASGGIGSVLDYLLYHTVSPLALDIMYWSFGVLVVAMLWVVPPRWKTTGNRCDEGRAAVSRDTDLR
jgi:hypothetical protein